MVLSDGMVHFLKIEKKSNKFSKLSCGFNPYLHTHTDKQDQPCGVLEQYNTIVAFILLPCEGDDLIIKGVPHNVAIACLCVLTHACTNTQTNKNTQKKISITFGNRL